MEKRKRKKKLTEDEMRNKLRREDYSDEDITHRLHMEKELKRVNVKYVWQGKNKTELPPLEIQEQKVREIEEEPEDDEERIMRNLSNGRGDLEGY
jgi:hypothetical protein